MAAQEDSSATWVVQAERVSVTPAMEVAQPIMTTPTRVRVEMPMMNAPRLGMTATPQEEMRLELPMAHVIALEAGQMGGDVAEVPQVDVVSEQGSTSMLLMPSVTGEVIPMGASLQEGSAAPSSREETSQDLTQASDGPKA